MNQPFQDSSLICHDTIRRKGLVPMEGGAEEVDGGGGVSGGPRVTLLQLSPKLPAIENKRKLYTIDKA